MTFGQDAAERSAAGKRLVTLLVGRAALSREAHSAKALLYSKQLIAQAASCIKRLRIGFIGSDCILPTL